MTIPNREQRIAAELFFSETRGWRDGAARKAMDRTYVNHSRKDMSGAYERGYQAGCDARMKMTSEVAERVGHVPNILRAEDG